MVRFLKNFLKNNAIDIDPLTLFQGEDKVKD